MAIATTEAEGVRVERCASCGARYNVTRFATGTRFACRRCGGVVTVSSTAAEVDLGTAPMNGGARPSLFVAGLVLLVGVALRSLPSAYTGEAGGSWAATLSALALHDAAALGLAALAALLAFAGSTRRAGVALHGSLLVLLLVLFLRAHGPHTPVLRLAGPDPAGAAALALLGAGSLALGSRRVGSRGAARPLLWVGVAVLVAAAASRFAAGPAIDEGRATTAASLAFDQYVALRGLALSIWRGEALPGAPSVYADALVVVAAALGLLAALAPGSRGGAFSRGVGRVAFLLLVVALATPHAATLWAYRDQWLGAGGGVRVATDVASAIFDGGLGLWLALSAAGAALVMSRGGLPRTRARSGSTHVLTAITAAGAAAILVNPSNGVLATSMPWTLVLERPLSAAAVVVTLLAALALAALACAFVPPLRGRGTWVALSAAAAACVSDLAVPSAGVPRFAFAALLAIAAGALVARRGPSWDGRGRAVAAAAAATIVLLLAYPAGELGQGRVTPYPCAVDDLVVAVRAALDGDARPADLVADPTLFATATAGIGAILVLLSAVAGPRGILAFSTAALAVALALHAPAHAAADAFARTPPSSEPAPLLVALAAAALAVRASAAASVLGTIGASADAVSGTPR